MNLHTSQLRFCHSMALLMNGALLAPQLVPDGTQAQLNGKALRHPLGVTETAEETLEVAQLTTTLVVGVTTLEVQEA